MASEERKALIEEANELGLEFAKNISDKKLASMIREEKGEPEPVDEEAPEGPAVKSDEELASEGIPTPPEVPPTVKAVAPGKPKSRKALIAERRRKAMELSVVTITNRDKRDNEVVTTAHLSVENQFFSISKIVPLDVAVELEACLIKNAETIMIPIHVDEIVNGRRTGNKITKHAKKYTVSYAKKQD